MGHGDPRRQRHRQPQQQWHPPRPSAAASPSAQTRDTKQRHALSSRVSADPRERLTSAPASSQRRDLVPSDAPRRRSRNSPTSSPSREEPVTKRLALFSFQAIPHHTLPSCANCIESIDRHHLHSTFEISRMTSMVGGRNAGWFGLALYE